MNLIFFSLTLTTVKMSQKINILENLVKLEKNMKNQLKKYLH